MRALVHFRIQSKGAEPLRFFFAAAQDATPQAALPFGARVLLPVALGSALGFSPEDSARLATAVDHFYLPLSRDSAWIDASLTLPPDSLSILGASHDARVERARAMIGLEIGASVVALGTFDAWAARQPQTVEALRDLRPEQRVSDSVFDLVFAAVEAAHVAETTQAAMDQSARERAAPSNAPGPRVSPPRL